MIYCEITHIKKEPRNDPYKRIEEVGGPYSDFLGPALWRCSLDEAIRASQAGYVFFTRRGLLTSKVELHTGPSGLLHLKTESDSTIEDNLLSLPDLDSQRGVRFVQGPAGTPVNPLQAGIISSAMKM